MTDESAFVAMLDANPDDHVTRDLFAEWCEDVGDERQSGMRWLAANRKRPMHWRYERDNDWFWRQEGQEVGDGVTCNVLPAQIFLALAGYFAPKTRIVTYSWRSYLTRQSAEDAFALAYLAVQSAADELRRVRGEIAEMLHVPAKPTGKFIPPGSFEAAVGQLGRLKLKEASLRAICGEPETEAATAS
jgi:hypothetical protein